MTRKIGKVPATNPAWELGENSAMRVSRRHVATVVRVERGTVLVTQQGDTKDHVLERGDELFVGGSGLAVAWAFTDAKISVREAGPYDGRRAAARLAG